MSIEFIPAKDLPVLEAESPDVLAVDPATGAMGRVPGANLGGGAGGYMMKPTAEECIVDGTTITITTNYDEMAKVLEAGGHVTVVFPAGLLADGTPAIASSVIAWVYQDGAFMVIVLMEISFQLVFPNGTYVPNLE